MFSVGGRRPLGAKAKLLAAVDTLTVEQGPAANEHVWQLLVRCKCLLYLAQAAAGDFLEAKETLADAKRLLEALPDRLQQLVVASLIMEGPSLPAQWKLVDALNFRQAEVWVYRGMYRPAGEEEQALRDINKGLALEPTKTRILWMRGFCGPLGPLG